MHAGKKVVKKQPMNYMISLARENLINQKAILAKENDYLTVIGLDVGQYLNMGNLL